jgi:recombination protein RecT
VSKLKKCTPISLINSVIEISILGLEVGRTAHIIPFKDEAVVIVDYKGMIELAHRSEKVTSTPMKAVYSEEFFEHQEGTERYIKHIPLQKDRGDLVAAYAIVNFKDGNFDFEVVYPDDIDLVKKRSPGAKKSDSPWNTDDEPQMWCKTAMRKLAKRIPQSPELQKAAYLEELVEAGLKQNISHVTNGVIDADFTTTEKSNETDPKDVKEEIDKKITDMQNKQQAQKTTPCPDKDGEEISTEVCNVCDHRNGCPSWE